jgi:hypothetical protein
MIARALRRSVEEGESRRGSKRLRQHLEAWSWTASGGQMW